MIRSGKIKKTWLKSIILLLLLTIFLFLGISWALLSIEFKQSLEVLSQQLSPDGDLIEAALHYFEKDCRHVEDLATRWPLSFFELVSEWLHLVNLKNEILTKEGVPSVRGYTIYNMDSTSRLHQIEVAIKARHLVFAGNWGESNHQKLFHTYRGYPIIYSPIVNPHTPEQVNEILETIPIPDKVFTGYSLYLLPFALIDIAGLSVDNAAIIGASPPNAPAGRLEYAVLHELGHHIHFRYLRDNYFSKGKWSEYLNIRGIKQWQPSGPIHSEAWKTSVEETFAEDFRILFGSPQSTIAHGTNYPDPRVTEDKGASILNFIKSLLH